MIAGPGDREEIERLQAEVAALRAELAERNRGLAEDCARETALRYELQHRARNTLALVRSVFARTVESAGTLEDLDHHFRGRLDVLARQQDVLRRSGVDLENLLRGELHGFQFGDLPQIRIEGPEVRVPADHAQPLALAFHELVTNALKFGALSVPGGKLSVTWKSDDDLVELVWAESGIAIEKQASLRRGFSREYIEDALPYRTGAETRFELRPEGLLCLIQLWLRPQAMRTSDIN